MSLIGSISHKATTVTPSCASAAQRIPGFVLVVFALILTALALPAFAQKSPVGLWRSVDDATGQSKAVIEIYDTGNGQLSAKIVKLIDTSDGPNPLCDQCSGARKNKPILGMVIAWSLKRDGKSWSGGRILDPENGKEYSVKMTPIAGGKKLEVRGFLGVALLGRTQVWYRQEP
jgi:uncharacterized protein (DUF2147 family)